MKGFHSIQLQVFQLSLSHSVLFAAEFFSGLFPQYPGWIHTQKGTFHESTIFALNTRLLIIDLTISILIDARILWKVSSLEVVFMTSFEEDFATHATHHTIVTTIGFLGLGGSPTDSTLSHVDLWWMTDNASLGEQTREKISRNSEPVWTSIWKGRHHKSVSSRFLSLLHFSPQCNFLDTSLGGVLFHKVSLHIDDSSKNINWWTLWKRSHPNYKWREKESAQRLLVACSPLFINENLRSFLMHHCCRNHESSILKSYRCPKFDS